MLLFRSEAHIERWCHQWNQEQGTIISLEQQWKLAKTWYADRMTPNWQRKTPGEIKSVFAQLGLGGGFWKIEA